MARKKRASRPRRKPWGTITLTAFWAGVEWHEENKYYGLAQTFKKPWQNDVLSTCTKWQEKKQTRGRRRPSAKSSGAPLKRIRKYAFGTGALNTPS